MENKKNFYAKASDTRSKIALGSILLVAGFLFVTYDGSLSWFIPVGAIWLSLGIWQKKPLIVLHDDYFEMKAAPAAPKHFICYSDIVSVKRESEKKAILTTKEHKTIRLPFRILSFCDQEDLLSRLQEKVTA